MAMVLHSLYFCDAAIDLRQRGTGIAVIVRDAAGHIMDHATRFLPPMTNNEAEYEAFILGLQLALERRDSQSTFLLDSQIVIGQIAGCFAVRDPRLAWRHARASRLLAQIPDATIIYVQREQNGIADALAKETLQQGLGRGQYLSAQGRWRP